VDVRAAQRPTRFIANSRNVANRVRRWYGREADVLPCPVDVDRFSIGRGEGDYAVVVSRLLPYKRVDRAIAGCALARGAAAHRRQRTGCRAAAGTRARNADDVSRRGRRCRTQCAGRRRARGDSAGRGRFRPGPARGGGGRPADARLRGRRRARDDRRGPDRCVLFAKPTANRWPTRCAVSMPGAFDPSACARHAQTFAPAQFVARLRALVDETAAGRR